MKSPLTNSNAPGAASWIVLSTTRIFAVQLAEPVMPDKNKIIPPMIHKVPEISPMIE